MKMRKPVEYLSRFAARRYPGSLNQEPPRKTRFAHSPRRSQAPPSEGAPA